ncbi:hypothetical protein TELCIR_13915 [Teladorsagia circumcincta]|uniref:IF rod domain-containing protein n=1 Tax=Teladorsagia circumcincta TaxID=45464 RepID=A0A2G9U2I2_TELCI|nr:hypothetical protein TELCIR_13915 [Teladorsagia circumcincta]
MQVIQTLRQFLKGIDFIRLAEQGDRARCAELRSQISKAEADLELQLRENGRLADERAQLSSQNAALYHEYDRIWEEIDRVRLELAEYQAREERLNAEKEFLMKDIKLEYEASHKLIRNRVTTYYHQKVFIAIADNGIRSTRSLMDKFQAEEMRRIAEARGADEMKHRLAQIAKMEGTIGDLRTKFRPLEDRNHLLEKEYSQLQNSIRTDEERYEREKRRRDEEYRNALAMYQRLLVEQGSMSEVMLLELEIYRKMIECEEKSRTMRESLRVKDVCAKVKRA